MLIHVVTKVFKQCNLLGQGLGVMPDRMIVLLAIPLNVVNVTGSIHEQATSVCITT